MSVSFKVSVGEGGMDLAFPIEAVLLLSIIQRGDVKYVSLSIPILVYIQGKG